MRQAAEYSVTGSDLQGCSFHWKSQKNHFQEKQMFTQWRLFGARPWKQRTCREPSRLGGFFHKRKVKRSKADTQGVTR